MAITAKFIADFSSFNDAVDKAELNLKSFETNANKVGTSLNRMVDNFSGRKVMQEATLMAQAVERIGGPTKLTAAELQKVANTASDAVAKMRALGVDVPPKIQALANQVQPLPGIFGKVSTAVTAVGGALGLAFTGAAILNGIKNQITAAADYADKLALLRAKTELGYRDLQILEDVGLGTGVSIEALANSVQILQMRLGDGTAKKGIQALGLSFDALLRMGPAEQFATIGGAIAKIEDPTQRAKVAAEVFGRTWKEIIPVLKANMAEAAKGAKLVGDAQIDATDRAGDRWTKFWSDQKRGWAAWAGDLILNMEKGMASFDEASRRAAAIRGGGGGTPTLPGAPGVRINNGPSVNDVSPEMISNLKVYGMTLEENAKQAERNAKAERDATRAREQFAEMSRAGLGPLYDWQQQILLSKFKTDQLTVSETQLTEATRTLADFVAEHQGEIFPSPPPAALELTDQAKEILREMLPPSVSLTEQMALLGRSFEQMGNIAGGAMSSITRGVGTMVSAVLMAQSAVGTLKAGFSSFGDGGILKGLMGIVGGIGGIASAAAAAIQVVKGLWNGLQNLWGGGEEGRFVNPARDEWFNGRSVQDIGDQLSPFMDGEQARQMIDRVFKARTRSEFQSASSAIDNVLKTGGAIPMAAGGMGRVTKPTLFLAGESGAEDFAFSGANKRFNGGGVTINVQGSVVTERELMDLVAQYQNDKHRRKNYVRAA